MEQKVSLPDIKKLEFGNPEQIKALKQYRNDLAIAEDEASMKDFEVTVDFSGSWSGTVRAHDEEEAKMIVEDGDAFDIADADFDFDSIEIK